MTLQDIRYPENSPVQIENQIPKPWTNFFRSVYEACFSIYQSGTTAQRPTKNRWVGRSYWDTDHGHRFYWNGTKWITGETLTKAWSFDSPSGSTGVFFWGGFLIDAGSDNDFNPSVNLGTANKSYAAHVYFVAASGATDTEITVTGTRITDAGVRTASYVATVKLTDGAAGSWYETSEKFIGLVAIVKTAGTDRLCNYGFAKYYDNNNQDFTVKGLEVTGLAGANDTGFNMQLVHYKSTGWTYNAGSSATFPTPIADLQTDHNTEYQLANGQEFAWKRSNLDTDVSGSASEGTMYCITTTANKAVELGNLLLRIQS